MFGQVAVKRLRRTLLLVALACGCGAIVMVAGAAPAIARAHRTASSTGGEPTARVTVSTGRLQGGVVGGGRQWLGIPYAAPPVGRLRWRPPAPAQHWKGVRKATRFGSACLQSATQYGVHRGSENCLYLNVYAPGARAGRRRLPVMVWLHGGGFVNGSGNDFNGRFLAATARAIVVTVNYRLGPFGWLALESLGQGGTSGDYGLMTRSRRSDG
jgi:para-nitrobenzyl esterase